MPRARRRECRSESRTRAIVPSRSPMGTAGSVASSVVAAVSAGWRSRSINSVSSAMPPTPSVTAWCTFIASAAPSPSSPSNKVNSHSGRARSNAADAIGCSASSSARRSPGAVSRTRRRWKSRSNDSSTTHRGGPRRNGGESTRWRRRGMTRVARSMRARNRFQSGARSRMATARMVDRRIGSFSMFHMRASSSLMWRSKRASVIGPPYSHQMCWIVSPRSGAVGGYGVELVESRVHDEAGVVSRSVSRRRAYGRRRPRAVRTRRCEKRAWSGGLVAAGAGRPGSCRRVPTPSAGRTQSAS